MRYAMTRYYVGGLYITGTLRRESRRIDNQLRAVGARAIRVLPSFLPVDGRCADAYFRLRSPRYDA